MEILHAVVVSSREVGWFEIIDTANSAFALKVKEAMHIGWEKTNLNVQQMTVQVSITV